MKTGEDQKICNGVLEWYEGKSIFITGAGGYLGTILLEILLRCIPGIESIYILLRAKKGVEPASRKKQIFEKKIFKKLLTEKQDVKDKVHVVSGDVSQPNLGMSEKHFSILSANVSVVFHVAATISFIKPLRFTISQNSVGTFNIIEMCRKFKKLEALVYTSTAYSNCNRTYIEENIYRLPFTAERYLDALKNGEIGQLEKLVSEFKPDLPNDYTFSKCLAENILNDMAQDLPVAVIRPSIIGATWKGPLPSYIEKGTGLVDLGIAVGKGMVKVLLANENCRADLVPVDIVANAHVVAAWSVATKRSSTPLIVNSTGGPWKVYIGEYCETLLRFTERNMLPKSFQEPSFHLAQNKLIYQLKFYYEHYIPALFLDIILYFKGSKLRLYAQYRFLEEVMSGFTYFINNSFEFAMDNFNALSEQLNQRDKEIFYMDLSEVSLEKIVSGLADANTFFDWKIDKKSPEKRKRLIQTRTMMINCIKRSVVLILCCMVYKVVKGTLSLL